MGTAVAIWRAAQVGVNLPCMRTLYRTLLLTIVVAGCDAEQPAPRPRARRVTPVDTPAASEPVRRPTTWNPAAGTVLLVAGDQPEHVIVVSPEVEGVVDPGSLDVSELAGAPASLFARTGTTVTATLGEEVSGATTATCNGWPLLLAAPGTPRWNVGFLDHPALPLALDSLAGLTRGDSLALVTRIARLASGLEENRSGPHASSFAGLPFVVADARAFTRDSLHVVVAQVVRRVNQEASPLEEHTTLIAERGAAGEWRVARAERMVGAEETVGREELLAAVVLDGQPTLVFIRDGGSEVRYVIRWRGAGKWGRQWVSAASRCGQAGGG